MSHVPSRPGASARALPRSVSVPAASPLRGPRGGTSQYRGTALVTGASSGIGAAVARRLATAGDWRLVLNGRDATRLQQVAEETSGITIPIDLTQSGAGRRLTDLVLDHTGGVDLLVASAGVGWAGPFVDMPPAAITEVFDADLSATVHLVRHLLPHMLAAGSGRVVIIGSIAGSVGVKGEAVYSAAKAALVAFTDALRYELCDTGVGITLVVPGAVDTPFFDRRGVPYRRSRPKPLPPDRVAEAVWNAVRHGKDEVYVPGWLRLPARVRGTAPAFYRRLAARFG
ncbi:SDR family NAD(P)-dependent oxidoreductase [Streptomyces bobili]|uniref:SDR family NAD(P)-dependent oxidoreductase n=1 Tax=Streptomyces bobili TaxID=67280 RepID=UPI0033BBD781